MSEVSSIEHLSEHVGETVTLRGWLYNKSSKGKLHFAQVRDGTGICQCVLFQKNVPAELFEAIGHAGQESSLILTGEVKEDPRAPGGYELSVSDGRVLQSVEGYPITPKEHGTDFLLNHRHLWLRSKRTWAVMRVRDCVSSRPCATSSTSAVSAASTRRCSRPTHARGRRLCSRCRTSIKPPS